MKIIEICLIYEVDEKICLFVLSLYKKISNNQLNI